MLLLKRFLKDHRPDAKPEELDADPAAAQELLLQLLRFYNSERLVLLKCIQVVLLKAGEPDEGGALLSDLLTRLVSGGLEEQLHARLRENLEGGAAAITRRLKAAAEAAAAATQAAAALPAPAGALAPAPAAGAGAGAASASLAWMSAAHAEMRSQLVAERLELLHGLLLLYELPSANVRCKPERAQALARLLLDRVFASTAVAAGGNGVVADSTDPPTQLSQQLAVLLLLSCLDLEGHVRLATEVAVNSATAPGAAAPPAPAPPLGGKTLEVHNQLRQYAASPATALLLLTWAACLRLLEACGAGSGGGAGGALRDLDAAARELESRAAAVGGMGAAAGSLAALFGGAVGALLLVYRQVALSVLCVLCTAYELGADSLEGSTYDTVAQLLRLCVEGDARACAALWDEGSPTTAPLRALLAAAARLFPAVPRPLLRLLASTAASPEAARAAYSFLQRSVSLVVLHPLPLGPGFRQLGGGEVELTEALPWNLAPSVPGLALPQGCVGSLCPLPASMPELRGRYALIAWDAEVSGGGGQSRGQVLLLGRASHCVAALEASLAACGPLPPPSDPRLLDDLADTLAALAALTGQEPALATDLLAQSVPFAGGTTRGWTDVAAGVLALGPALAERLLAAPGAASASALVDPSSAGSFGGSATAGGALALQILADAASLLGAIAAAAPGRVLALLPSLPLLASPADGAGGAGGLLGGLPAAVPLHALPAFSVPPRIDFFCGLLPTLSALQRELERPAGRYPLTLALLSLLSGLLEKGFSAPSPLPAAALWVLHEVLPDHHHWRYTSAKERWALTHGSLRLLRLALTAGSFVSDPDLTALVAAPPSATVAATLAAGPGGGGGSNAIVPYSAAAAAAAEAAAADGAASAAPPLTPDLLLSESGPILHVSTLSAALLRLLLLHGGALLARCLPPPAEVLERLRADDPSRPELPPLEGCAAELAALLPPLLTAAGAHPQEQPLEEWLLAGGEPPPAAHVVSYVAYQEADRDSLPPERQISYLALRALACIAACVARPVSRALPCAALSLAMPPGCPAEACLRALLRGEAAAAAAGNAAAPELASLLAAAAVGRHPMLLDGLLFPSALEEELMPAQAAAAAATTGGGADGAGTSTALVPAAGGGAKKGPAKPRHALDGLYATLQAAARLKRDAPQVLASALRVVAAMWRQPAAAARAVGVLRSAPGLWPALDACLQPVTAADADAVAPDAEAHRTWVEAYALQILTAEAYARSRAAGAARGGAEGANASANSGSGAEAVLDKLARSGLLLGLLRGGAEPVAAALPGVGALGKAVAAMSLELGAEAVAELWGPPGEPDAVSVAPAVREELSGVRALLGQGSASLTDIQTLHDDLLAAAATAAAAAHGGASPGGGSGSGDDGMMAMTPPTAPLAMLMERRCLGGAVVSRCHVATSDLASLPGGALPPPPGAGSLLSRVRLAAALGPAAESLPAAELAAAAMDSLSVASDLGEARVALLQAAAWLTGLLARDGRLMPSVGAAGAAATLLDPLPPPSAPAEPSTPGRPAAAAPSAAAAGSPGILTSVAAACTTAVGSLLTWAADPEARPASQQPDWGLRRLHAQRLAAALAAARLLLTAIQAARPVLTAASTNGGGSAAAVAASAPLPPRAPTSAGFGTPIRTPGGLKSLGLGISGASSALPTTLASDPSYLPLVVQLMGQLDRWVRVVGGASLPQCPPSYVAAVTDALAGAALAALQPLPPPDSSAAEAANGAAADRQRLTAALLSCLPHVCELASSGGLSPPLAAQLLTEATRHLATHEWLPLLLANIDWGQHILVAAGRAANIAASAAAGSGGGGAGAGGGATSPPGIGDAAAAAGDLGLLALAVTVAQVPDGARALYDRGVVHQLVAAGRHLLSSNGGRLAAFSVISVTGTGPYRPGVDGTYASTSAAAYSTRGGGSLVPDLCGAYLPASSFAALAAAGGGGGAGAGGAAGPGSAEWVWSPVHRQWCSLLQFSVALLRTLGQHVDVEREALDLLLALEPRLMLAVLPPGGDGLQPLTLAGLVEAEAALFLLCALTPYLGGWHMVLPTSLLNFRTAASTLLTWLAQPTLTKQFAVDCRPRTAREAALAAAPSPAMPASHAWFRVATSGAAAPPPPGAAAGASAAAAAAVLAAAGAAAGLSSPLGGAAAGGVGGLPGSPIGPGGAASPSPSLRGSLSNTPSMMTRSASELLGSYGLGTPAAGGAGSSAAAPSTPGGASGAAAGLAAGGAGGYCSEYSAQVAEKLYSCAAHALAFLAATSPQLAEGEASSLGPAWPRPRDLAALLDQAMHSAEALTAPPLPADGAASAASAGGPAAVGRRLADARLLGRVGQLCDQFLRVLSAGAGGGGGGGAGAGGPREAHAREWLASLEQGGGVGAGN
ncbi:hypothetical protein HYH03_004847 [Edaphochlamys debaryana]|uniref:Uncharacterized protein n=1 Tax=Edaphochlamys debaryana TaxID=47281 RepID=A0A836C2Z9_9CHLO|nr:hypothetical protein HYH03_004847 [Edaphochlamys debaryana]|eukprot:KAG2497263.1 hypothetical protein HYH03_004847 [Edaphochlamys debaryana]